MSSENLRQGRQGAWTANSLLSAVMEAADDAIIAATLEGRIGDWNAAAERMFGYSAAEILDQPTTLLVPADRRDQARELLDRISRGECIEHYETEWRGKSGNPIAVSLNISPLRDGAGRIVGALQIVRDVTPKNRTHAALREREAELQSVLDTVPDAMVVIDERGVIQSFSAAAERMFGFTAEEAKGQNVSILMPSPHREHHDAYIARYLATGERHIIGVGRVVAGRRKDGTTFPIELAIGEARRGEHRLFIGFIRDLTERQRTQKRLQELQAELSHVSRLSEMSQMGSALAHEINQPLTAALNYLRAGKRVLAGGDTSAGKAATLTDKAVEQVERASEIVRHLRAFVRKGYGQQQPENLPHIIEEASALALLGTKERGVTVRLRTRADLPRVMIDKIQIQQVLVNLMRNAVEAMEDCARRELTVETGRADEHFAEVRVIDTGPGIAPEIAGRLFQPFVTTKTQGMGVGLSICRTIVESHGGRLWVEANPEGGSVFRFTVPVATSSSGTSP